MVSQQNIVISLFSVSLLFFALNLLKVQWQYHGKMMLIPWHFNRLFTMVHVHKHGNAIILPLYFTIYHGTVHD